MKHQRTALDQAVGIDLSLGPCDHSPMGEVGGGNWLRKKLAKFTYSYLLILAG